MLLLLLSGEAAVDPPTTDIGPPLNLSVYRYGSKWVELMWEPPVRSADRGVASYKMYVNGTWDGVTIRSVYNTSTMAADKLSLTPGTQYSFYVTAVDSTGEETTASNTVTITTPRNTDVGKFKRRRYAL